MSNNTNYRRKYNEMMEKKYEELRVAQRAKNAINPAMVLNPETGKYNFNMEKAKNLSAKYIAEQIGVNYNTQGPELDLFKALSKHADNSIGLLAQIDSASSYDKTHDGLGFKIEIMKAAYDSTNNISNDIKAKDEMFKIIDSLVLERFPQAIKNRYPKDEAEAKIQLLDSSKSLRENYEKVIMGRVSGGKRNRKTRRKTNKRKTHRKRK
jgi:hypothetical protein